MTQHLLGHPRENPGGAVGEREVVVFRTEDTPIEQVEGKALVDEMLDEAGLRHQIEDVWPADPEVRDKQNRSGVSTFARVAIQTGLVFPVDLLTWSLSDGRLSGAGHGL